MSGPSPFSRYLAVALTVAAVSWTAALLLVAFGPPPRIPPTLAVAVHAVGRVVCHQRAERSFHAHGRRFPVCARCTGLYLSGAIGALFGWLGRIGAVGRTRMLLAAAAVPTAASVVLEWAGVPGSSNLTRALSALPLGGISGWLFVRMLRAESRPITCAMIA